MGIVLEAPKHQMLRKVWKKQLSSRPFGCIGLYIDQLTLYLAIILLHEILCLSSTPFIVVQQEFDVLHEFCFRPRVADAWRGRGIGTALLASLFSPSHQQQIDC